MIQSECKAMPSVEKHKECLKKIEHAEILIHCPTTKNVELALQLAEECLQFNSCDTRSLCVKASCLYLKGQYEQAIAQFQQILLIEPSHSTALWEIDKITMLKNTIDKGEVSLAAGQLQDALDHFKEAQKIVDSNLFSKIRFHCKNAEIYLKMNNRFEAIAEYTEALELDNNCLEALLGRAVCFADVEKYAEAVEDYEKLIAVAEREDIKQWAIDSIANLKDKTEYRTTVYSSELLMKYLSMTKSKILCETDIEVTLELAEKCLQLDISDTRALFVKGSCLFYKGQYDLALAQYKQIIHLQPSHLTALSEINKITSLKNGNDSFIAGRWQDALDSYEDASKVINVGDDLYVKLNCKKAEIYLKLNKIDGAIKDYTNALLADSGCVDAMRGRARCHADVENYEKAIKDYEQVCAIVDCDEIKQHARNSIATLTTKKEYQLKVNRAEVLIQCPTTENLKLALGLAEECLQFNSTDKKALCVKGSYLYYKGQYEQALGLFQQILLIEPLHVTALWAVDKITMVKNAIERGEELLTAGRWHDALDNFKEILKIAEGNLILKVNIYCKNAEIYLKLDNKFQAIAEYTEALELDNNCLEALLGRAVCFADVEKYEEAVEDYETLIAVDKRETIKQKAQGFVIKLKELMKYGNKLDDAELWLKRMCFFNLTQKRSVYIEAALNVAEECLQFNSSDIRALCVKGSCLYHMHQYDSALTQYRQILHLKPSHATALRESDRISRFKHAMGKGNDLFKAGRWQEALDSFEEASVISATGNYLHVKLYCKKAEILHLKLNQVIRAINEYTIALLADTECVDALRGRALCYADVENYKKAIEDYVAMCAIKNCEEEIKQHARGAIDTLDRKQEYQQKVEHAEILIQSPTTKNLTLALELGEECLKFDSSDKRALCVKGLCLYYMGQYDLALVQYQQILLLQPSHPTALTKITRISEIKLAIEKGDESFVAGRWQDALESFEKASVSSNYNKHLRFKLCCKMAEVYLKLDQINRAIDEYTNALLADGDCIEALRGRAQCYTNVGNFKKAIEDYEKLYAIDQNELTKGLLHQAKTAQIYRLVQEKVGMGNRMYRLKKFGDALGIFKEAIRLCPDNPEYRSNAFSCYLELTMLKEALVEAKAAVALDAKSTECSGAAAKCYIALGDLSGAERVLSASAVGGDVTDDRRALDSLQRLHAQAQKYIAEHNYERAVTCMDQCLHTSPFSSQVKLIKAECLMMWGKVKEALEIADDCIRIDHTDVDATFVKGLCFYYDEQLELAMKYFKEALRLSPDHRRASATYKKAKLLDQKLKQGNEELKMCRWQKALLLFNEALTIDPTHVKANATLHCDRATVYRKLKQIQAAVEAYTEALELDQELVRALWARAACFIELGEFESAVDDYEQLYRVAPSGENKALLNRAKQAQGDQTRRRDYYTILGIAKTATQADIIKAYRQLARDHHPDRHAGRPKCVRKQHERRFKEVGEAYAVLKDSVPRRQYDATANDS